MITIVTDCYTAAGLSLRLKPYLLGFVCGERVTGNFNTHSLVRAAAAQGSRDS